MASESRSLGDVYPEKEVMQNKRLVNLGYIRLQFSKIWHGVSHFRMKLILNFGRLESLVIFEVSVVGVLLYVLLSSSKWELY